MDHQCDKSSKIDIIHYGEFNYDLLNSLIYRGEGNSSIVVALRTKPKVIRLLKKDGKLMRTSLDHHVTQHPMRSIQFIHFIMKPLTAPFMSEETHLAHLKSDIINMISKKVELDRPSHRLNKTLHLDDQYALIMDDLCALPTRLTKNLNSDDLIGPTISVEIKPKQGFLPHVHRPTTRPFYNDQIAAKIKGNCLYGLTQKLKLARGRITQISNYCPIKLFSGCPVKMKVALEDLMQQPQNNLRIFKDLALAYDETNRLKLQSLLDNFFPTDHGSSHSIRGATIVRKIDAKQRFIELLIQCLTNQPLNGDAKIYNSAAQHKGGENNFIDFNDSDICLQHSTTLKCKRCDTCSLPVSNTTDFTKSTTSHKLPRSCVLAKVLQAQRLDSIGAFEARYMLEWLLDNSLREDKSIDVLEELSRPHMPAGFGAAGRLQFESKQDYYFRKVWEFLVSLTAKDCSIMVTLQKVRSDRLDNIINKNPEVRKHLLRENAQDSHYLFNVSIADFDQKMPLKILRICDNLNHVASQTHDFDRPNKRRPVIYTKQIEKILFDE